MRVQLAQHVSRLRSASLSTLPPPRASVDYNHELARVASSILYRSPDRPTYILNAAALPEADKVDFNALLPYVLARLPGEEELLSGTEYEVIVFAGAGGTDRATGAERKNRPGWAWFLQAYQVLGRATRKRLQKLYIVHEKDWVTLLTEVFSGVVSPKFRRKIVHASSLGQLATHLPIDTMLIPPSAYLHDRTLPLNARTLLPTCPRAFHARKPFPRNATGDSRLPRILREATSFLLMEPNVRTEGIFRIPPHSRLKEIVKEAYDHGQRYILWKDNGVMLPLPPFDASKATKDIVDEIDPRDCYGVHLAAGLIKTWYAELRQPIFPQSAYRELKALFGSSTEVPSRKALVDLISPSFDRSFIPAASREILVRHLLPMLSVVVERQTDNKMSAENVAVCFAPTLVCGPDQIEDANMSTIVRRILTAAVDMWAKGLRNECGIEVIGFSRDLQPPLTSEDYEDPPPEPARNHNGGSQDLDIDSPLEEDAGFADSERQLSGILLQDNADDAEPPALPPRPSVYSSRHVTGNDEPSEMQKQAVSIRLPSRESSQQVDAHYTYTVAQEIPSRSRLIKEEKPSIGFTGPGLPRITMPKRKALTAEHIAGTDGAASSPSSPDCAVPMMHIPSTQGTQFPGQLYPPARVASMYPKSIGSKPRSTVSSKRSVSAVQPLGSIHPSVLDPNERRPSLSPPGSWPRKPTFSVSTPPLSTIKAGAKFGLRGSRSPDTSKHVPSLHTLPISNTDPPRQDPTVQSLRRNIEDNASKSND